VPKPVALWTWRQMLRDHGPPDPKFLLAMLVLSIYMNRDGFGYPGQLKWAAGARMSLRSVQRHIQTGKRLGWLHVENAGRGGKGWAFNAYRCCVPDDLALEELDEKISEHIIAQESDVDGPAIALARPSPLQTLTNHHPNHGAAKTEAMLPPSGATGSAKQDSMAPPQLWRTNSGSENSGSRTQAQEEAHAFARDVSQEFSSKAKSKEPDEDRYRRIASYFENRESIASACEILKGWDVTRAEVMAAHRRWKDEGSREAQV
jgi:hypothetical protein